MFIWIPLPRAIGAAIHTALPKSLVVLIVLVCACFSDGATASFLQQRQRSLSPLRDVTKGTATSAGLNDIAIGLISGREELWTSVYWAMLSHAPRAMIIQAPGKCDCSFVAGLGALRRQEPNASWYYIGDEDVFIDFDRLVELVASHDHSVGTVIAALGSHQVYEKVCGERSPILEARRAGQPGKQDLTFYGGTGILISRALVQRMNLDRPCGHTTGAADRDLSCLIGSSWQPWFHFVPMPALKGKKKSGGLNMDAQAYLHPVGVHHQRAADIAKLAHRNAHLGHFQPRTILLNDNHGCAPKTNVAM